MRGFTSIVHRRFRAASLWTPFMFSWTVLPFRDPQSGSANYCLRSQLLYHNPLVGLAMLFSDGPIVDHLPLFLSLRDNDERVETATEKMMEAVPW